jgi:hypothetical protein
MGEPVAKRGMLGLVVDVARGLDSGSMIEQAHHILMQVSYSVGYHRESVG